MPVDYSKLSDAELDALLAEDQYKNMSDAELDAELAKTEAPQEIKYTPEKRDISSQEAALRGIAQGSTLGFADRLSGAAGYLGGKLGLVPDVGYEYYRDYARNQDKQAAEQNPYSYGAGQLAGGGAIPGLNAAKTLKGAAGIGAGVGGVSALGSRDNIDVSTDTLLDVLKEAGWGALGGGVGQKVGSYLTGSKPAVQAVTKLADDLAEKATGATAAQAEKFAPGAGGILRREKLVGFFDSPENIAQKVAAAEKKSGDNIGRALKELDAQGVEASLDNIVAKLEGEIDQLNGVPGNDKLINKLQKEVDSLYNRGESTLKLSDAEKAKRNFQNQVNWNSSKNKSNAMYKVSDIFRNEVERAASEANPELAAQFLKDKELFSVLRPIKEASQRRATQLNQSPFGGLGDAASAAVGASGGPLGMAKAVVGRRLVAPRLSSTMSASAGLTADAMSGINRMLGGAAEPTSNAIQSLIRSLAVQSNPANRQTIDLLQTLKQSQPGAVSPWSDMKGNK